MPIFHEPQEGPPRRSSLHLASLSTLPRGGSPAHGLELLPMEETQGRGCADSTDLSKLSYDSDTQARKPSLLDRVDLIERLKRSNSPSWQQQQQRQTTSDWNPSSSLSQNGNFSQDSSSSRRIEDNDANPDSVAPFQLSRDRPANPLLPSATTRPSQTATPDPLRDYAKAGLEIERPRSALHSGDFREDKSTTRAENGSSSSGFLATSPVAPWNRSFPAAALPSRQSDDVYPHDTFSSNNRPVSRARATSQASSSSFAFLPPTSPLVQQANNTDLDFSSRASSRQSSRSPERNNRRHTFSPASFQGYQSVRMARSTSGTPAARHIRHTSSIPYQAHQPRRTSTYNPFHPSSSPQSPFLNSRPSFSTEASPIQHAPMVGSYEESILRGRMSTTPSRPLNFVAKIGVLGKGDCKSSLKCPPHVAVPFPAVFYSYNTGNGRISDNEPSPYVGLIDLENSLSAPDEGNDSKHKRRQPASSHEQSDVSHGKQGRLEDRHRVVKDDIRRREKRKRRSTSPKAPPGGSYRIPAQGQLQIVLKNPNKTAVKLFLVPYDVSDMEPGQKTFIRQRSYSAGPIIDMPASARKNLGTDRPEASLSNSDDPNDRPILRYLVHLHICCCSKDRYYLYKSIRVVFANRVPDGKEKLRNEIQLPEPRYSTYKPTRDSNLSSTSTSSAAQQLKAEKAFRRRSAGWPLSQSQQVYDQLDGLRQYPQLPPPAVRFTGGTGAVSSSASSGFSSPMLDLQPIPFSLPCLAAIESRPTSRDYMDIDVYRTPVASPKSGITSPQAQEDGTFEKLNKGDVGYGGNAFSPVSSPNAAPSAGLLSQRLRSLEFQRKNEANI